MITNMVSTRTSKRNSIVRIQNRELSKSVPETPAKRSHQPFRTVPDSPKHCRLLSDDHGLDIEVLTHKLQLYQLELEEAELRFKQRRMANKEAADVAAAARFLDEFEKRDLDEASVKQRAQSSSTQSVQRPFPNRTSSLRAPNMIRSKRPNPLLLAATTDAAPQEIQSAALPARRQIMSQEIEDNKRHWRRTTISAGRNTSSKVITISSPSGHHEEQNFDVEVPPVPELSASSSITSPSTISPMTPLPTEDQIRRELETFALEEGPDISISRRSSAASRKRLPAAFVPDPEDIQVFPKSPSLPPQSQTQPQPKALPSIPPDDFDLRTPIKNDLARKKSFFSRFERKNEVSDLLDLYMTEQQIEDHKTEKKKAHKSRRQTFFKRWQPNEVPPTPKSPNPG